MYHFPVKIEKKLNLLQTQGLNRAIRKVSVWNIVILTSISVQGVKKELLKNNNNNKITT